MRVAPLMTSGRTMLSTQLTAVRPQTNNPTAAMVLPDSSSQRLALPHMTGTTNGISATSAVSAPRKIGPSSPATA